MRLFGVDKPYEESIADIIQILSNYPDEVEGFGMVVLMKDRQWLTFFSNVDTIDKFAMAGIMQNEAQDDMDEDTHDNIKHDIYTALGVDEDDECESE